MTKLSWGVLSTARIGWEKVLPAMQRGEHCRIDAIASRDLGTARDWAAKLGIPKAYGSYEELLADPDIQAVYNPLPNHLHVPWTVKAAEAGKHVLCEKPVALTAEEAVPLLAARDRTGVRIQEAFMVRAHPQWLKAKEILQSGRIGEIRAIQGFFSYYNDDPDNIRNKADIGGGGMLDIGCYPTTTARFMLEAEPSRVVATIDRDPVSGIDRLGSAVYDFPGVQASYVYSTQLVPYQRMHFFGTKGHIEIEVPFNAPNDRPCRIFVDDGSSLVGEGIETVEIPTCDQYRVAGDAFSRAVLEDAPQPIPLEDAVANMRVIDAVFRSAASGRWETP
ncbi:MAG: Gfo/Idh/MocA family oxidoreductase [Inquilinus sp.]|nr:Gfo/Idh/MocA family oxidoreductase [Inquilinus sp.]